MSRGKMMRRVLPLLIGMGLSLSACANKHHARIIVVDPGHGGVDPGAIGSTSNILEKDITLRMGLTLRDQLEATRRYQVILTRDDDRTVQLCDRLQIARQSQGELLISIHADSLTTAPEVTGAAVYTLSDLASNEEPARSASKEECADTPSGIDPSNQEDIVPERMLDLAQRDAESVTLAELLAQELNRATKLVKQRPTQEGFVVLQSPEMPAVLIELGYLSNPADEKTLADDAHIARLATAVTRAVEVYFGAGPS
jgi:N-acetylmuramoyl-L-alanine amidase